MLYGGNECFFCFKQKKAYEKLMSDWSSDVCSSDLVAQIGELSACIGVIGPHRQLRVRTDRNAIFAVRIGGELRRPGDRKSVVEGKSVSVRVDLGGRRIIKKKTQLKWHGKVDRL